MRPTDTAARKMHVLLVEDDRLTRTVLRDQMRACGFGVTTAENGETALKLMQTSRGRVNGFDLVVTDVRMPKVDGAQLILQMQVHDRLKQIPVVVMSSNDAAEDVAELIKAGAVEYIVKPVDRSRLLALSRHVRDLDTALPDSCPPPPHKARGDAEPASWARQLAPSPPLTVCSGDSQDTKSGAVALPAISQALLNAIDSLTDSRDQQLERHATGVQDVSPPTSARSATARPGEPSQPRPVASLNAVKAEDSQSSRQQGDSSAAAMSVPPVQGVPMNTTFQLYPASMFRLGTPSVGAAQHSGSNGARRASGLSLAASGAALTFPVYIAQCPSLPEMSWPSASAHGGPRPMYVAVNLAGPRAQGGQVPDQASTTLARKLALERFRRKKANRDYTKKVRYEARKKLAEQRPRFKGQFVKLPVQQATS